MSVASVAVAVLLALAVLIVALSALGLLTARDRVARLHFLTPVTSIAAPLVGAAYVLDQGLGLGGGLVLVIVGLLAVTGPPLGTAIGRVTASNGDVFPSEPAG